MAGLFWQESRCSILSQGVPGPLGLVKEENSRCNGWSICLEDLG